MDNRAKMTEGKEATRKLLAEFMRVTPEEIIITRNTSEANNLVSNGIDLKAGDEVIVFSDNHPEQPAGMAGKIETVRFQDQNRDSGESASRGGVLPQGV